MKPYIKKSYLDSIGTLNVLWSNQLDDLLSKLERGNWCSIFFDLRDDKLSNYFPLNNFVLINTKTEDGKCFRPRFLKVDCTSKIYENIFFRFLDKHDIALHYTELDFESEVEIFKWRLKEYLKIKKREYDEEEKIKQIAQEISHKKTQMDNYFFKNEWMLIAHNFEENAISEDKMITCPKWYSILYKHRTTGMTKKFIASIKSKCAEKPKYILLYKENELDNPIKLRVTNCGKIHEEYLEDIYYVINYDDYCKSSFDEHAKYAYAEKYFEDETIQPVKLKILKHEHICDFCRLYYPKRHSYSSMDSNEIFTFSDTYYEPNDIVKLLKSQITYEPQKYDMISLSEMLNSAMSSILQNHYEYNCGVRQSN